MNARSIVSTIVGEVATRRAVGRVFVLDEAGHVVLWSRSAKAFPEELQPLVAMYFAQALAGRTRFTEVLNVSGATAWVRIVPLFGQARTVYALLVEPFAIRTPSYAATAGP
jgi:hypothetical protein